MEIKLVHSWGESKGFCTALDGAWLWISGAVNSTDIGRQSPVVHLVNNDKIPSKISESHKIY
jgi:hypothetical protein